MLEDVEGELCLLEVTEVMRCVQLRMLEVVEVMSCVLPVCWRPWRVGSILWRCRKCRR